MRRSISKIALALVAVLVVGFLAVSCSAGPKEHVHTLGTEHEAVKGTCQAKGELAYWDCKGCDSKLNEQGVVLESIEGEVDLNNHAGVGVWTAK
ncbi:MAG: hypothetical protein KBS81_03300 [Spirochaetales bacterium]|nr:hypothetical protein [Candidatus Physcosoma equi]